MPMRTKDGVVHAVVDYARPDFHGTFACGLIYEPRRKGASWQRRDHWVKRAERAPGPVTCLACAGDIRIHGITTMVIA